MGCTLQTCESTTSLYGYRPSLPANALFVSILSLCLIATLGIFVARRRYPGFTFFLCLTLAAELWSYAERIKGWQDPWNTADYIVAQIVSALAPVAVIFR